MIKFWMCFILGIFMGGQEFLLAHEVCGSLEKKPCMHVLLQNIKDPEKSFHDKEIAEDHFLTLSQEIMDIAYLLETSKSKGIRPGFAQRIARIVLNAGDETQKQEASRIVYPLWHALNSWIWGK